MKNVSISIAEEYGHKLGIQVYIPQEYKSLFGDYVRPEGTLASGLVLHCNVHEARGTTFAVQHKHASSNARMTLRLPERFIGAKLTNVKTVTPIKCEGEIVDGRQVVVFDKFDATEMYDRAPRRKRHKELPPITNNVATPNSNIDAIRDAVRVLRHKIRDLDTARAVITLVELARSEGVKLSFNGTELRAVVEHDLFK